MEFLTWFSMKFTWNVPLWHPRFRAEQVFSRRVRLATQSQIPLMHLELLSFFMHCESNVQWYPKLTTLPWFFSAIRWRTASGKNFAIFNIILMKYFSPKTSNQHSGNINIINFIDIWREKLKINVLLEVHQIVCNSDLKIRIKYTK